MLMIFFFIMPGVMSGLGNLLVPLQLSVPEMVFPKVNNLGRPPLTISRYCAYKHGVQHAVEVLETYYSPASLVAYAYVGVEHVRVDGVVY